MWVLSGWVNGFKGECSWPDIRHASYRESSLRLLCINRIVATSRLAKAARRIVRGIVLLLLLQNDQKCIRCVVPRFRLNAYGRRAFSVAGPMAWNSLPDFGPGSNEQHRLF